MEIKFNMDGQEISLEKSDIPGDGNCFYETALRSIRALKPDIAANLTVGKIRFILQREIQNNIDWCDIVSNIMEDFHRAIEANSEEVILRKLNGYKDPFAKVVNKVFSSYLDHRNEGRADAELRALGDDGKNHYLKMIGETNAWAHGLEIANLASLLNLNIIEVKPGADGHFMANAYAGLTLQQNSLCVLLLSDAEQRHFDMLDPIRFHRDKGYDLSGWNIAEGLLAINAPLDIVIEENNLPETTQPISTAVAPRQRALPHTQGTRNSGKTEADKKRENKIKDVNLILKMVETIDHLISETADKSKLLIDLASNANQITRFDSDADCIRNKYGNIEWNKRRNPRPEGICFEDIYHIKVILENNDHLLDSLYVKIRSDLNVLKSKLLYILQDQKAFIDEHCNQDVLDTIAKLLTELQPNCGPRLDKIEEAVAEEYSALAIKRIKIEVSDKSVDVDFATREDRYYFARRLTIIGELAKELPDNSPLRTALKSISEQRDRFIHNHAQLLAINSEEDATRMANIKSKLVAFQTSLEIALDIETANYKELQISASELCDAFKPQVEKADVVALPVTINNSASMKIDKIIRAALVCIEGKGKKRIDQINEEYLELFKTLPEEMQKIYPREISLANKDEILALGEKTQAALELRIRQEEGERKRLASDKKKNDFLRKIGQVNQELKYLQAIERMDLPATKKSYIFQHAINVIAELMREIRNENDILDDLNKIASSTFRSSQSSSIHARKSGLAHDIFSFNGEYFDHLVMDNILPAQEDVGSVHYILTNRETHYSSALIMNNIGVAYARLGLYENAINVLKQAREYLVSHPLETRSEKIRNSVGDAVARQLSASIKSDEVTFIDLDEELFGVDSYNYAVIDNLSNAYFRMGEMDKGIALLEELLNRINWGELNFYKDSFRNKLASTANNFATALNDLRRDEEAMHWFEISYRLASDKCLKCIAGIGFAECLDYAGFYKRAEEIRATLDYTSSAMAEFMSILHKFSKLGREENMSEENLLDAKVKLTQAIEFLENNQGRLKAEEGDRFELLDLKIIQMKSDICKRSIPLTEDELMQVQKDFIAKLDSLNEKFKMLPEVGKTCLSLSEVLIKQFSHQLNDTISIDMLNQALEYFVMAEERLGMKENKRLKDASRNLAIVYSNYGERKEELWCFDKALELHAKYKTYSGLTKINKGIALHNLAEKCDSRNPDLLEQYKSAIKLLREGCEVARENNSPADVSAALRSLGMCYESLSERTNNLDDLKKAINFYQEFLNLSGRKHPDFNEVAQYAKECETRLFARSIPVQPKNSAILATKLKEIEKKVLTAFSDPNATILKIYNIRKEDLELYCRERLGREDIEVKRLPSGKGYCIILTPEIKSGLNAISQAGERHR